MADRWERRRNAYLGSYYEALRAYPAFATIDSENKDLFNFVIFPKCSMCNVTVYEPISQEAEKVTVCVVCKNICGEA